MKIITQNIKHFIERLLRAAQRVPGSRMRPQYRGWEPLVYMNSIDSRSRVDEDVIVRSCSINRLLFADDLTLLASSQQSSACTKLVFCCMRPSWSENQH